MERVANVNFEKPLLIQSNKIKLTSYGIPQLDKGAVNGFYEDDTKREFIKIPFDDHQRCVALREHLKKADEYFRSVKFRKQFINNKNDECGDTDKSTISKSSSSESDMFE